MNSLLKILEFPTVDLNAMLVDKLIELHNDCSKNADPTLLQHTQKKMLALLQTKYKSWAWGEVNAVFNLGITEAYGKYSNINYATLAGWMKKAENLRGSNHAAREINENREIKQSEKQMFAKSAGDWAPVIQINLMFSRRLDSPLDLKEYIEKGKLTPVESNFLKARFPAVFTSDYAQNYDPDEYAKHYPVATNR